MPTASPANSEWLTRKRLIDGRLNAAGWRVFPFDATKPLVRMDRCAIEEYPTASGPADYALCLGGRIVAIVEAKKLTLGPQNVLSQAERYSKGISQPKLQAGVTAGETCPLLLAFVGREPSDEAAVWEYGAADCRAIASGGIAGAAAAGKSIQSQERTEGCLTKPDGKAAVSSCGTSVGAEWDPVPSQRTH